MNLRTIAVGALVGVAIIGCSDDRLSPVPEGTPVPVQLQTVASNPATTMSGLVLLVYGPNIPDTLFFSLGMPNASGTSSATTVYIPAGPSRTFLARGYVGSVQTHEGSVTRNITASGVAIKLHLAKLLGGDTITASVEDFNLAVDDSSGYRADVSTTSGSAGQTLSFTAKLTYAFTAADNSQIAGDPVAGKTIVWAADNPGILPTLSAATCTTGAAGTCTITATLSGSATSGQTVRLIASGMGVARAVAITVP